MESIDDDRDLARFTATEDKVAPRRGAARHALEIGEQWDCRRPKQSGSSDFEGRGCRSLKRFSEPRKMPVGTKTGAREELDGNGNPIGMTEHEKQTQTPR